jgi:adenine phosphoribosyltransferase
MKVEPMSLSNIKNAIRNVPDFPQKGIQFKDITTALKQPDKFKEIIDLLVAEYQGKKIDYVAGVESRGFIFGSALAYFLGCGFIPIRKKGKLPAEVLRQEYVLEYGTDIIEMHKDALCKDDNVLIVDDLLATGGTTEAAAKLVLQSGANITGFAFVIDLTDLGGRKKLLPYAPVFSLIEY